MKGVVSLPAVLSVFVILFAIAPASVNAQESAPVATTDESANPKPPATSVAMTEIAFQGYLTNAGGTPINGTVSLVLKLYDAPAGGNELWTETQPSVAVTNGVFSIALGSVVPLDPVDFTGSPIYLGVSVNGEAELLRTRLLASPFAIRAAEADHALTADVATDGVWSTSGGNAYRVTGNVGIGTATPNARLTVAGPMADVVVLHALNGNMRVQNQSPRLYISDNLGTGFIGTDNAKTILIAPNEEIHVRIGTAETKVFNSNFVVQNQNPRLFIADNLGTGYIGTDNSQNFVFAPNGTPYLRLTTGGRLEVSGTTSTEVLEITGADLVESFDTNDGLTTEPGTVMVIDGAHPGSLKLSSGPYDPKVAGVVSGAGGVSAGIHMGHGGPLDGDKPLAMTGRVYVKCTTENGPIRPGDRLTTSSTPGHAMKATDPTQSDGAVIGKAMSSLDEGTGLVLVLVNLQ